MNIVNIKKIERCMRGECGFSTELFDLYVMAILKELLVLTGFVIASQNHKIYAGESVESRQRKKL